MIRGGFQGLRAADHPDVVTGVLSIRRCRSRTLTRTSRSTSPATVGYGSMAKSKAGGTFTVHQYIRFSIATTIRGAIDMFYDRDVHMATLWFTPDRPRPT